MASLYNIPFVRHNPWFRWYIGTGYVTTKARSSRRGRIEDTIATLLRELRAFVVKYLTLSVSSQIAVAIEHIIGGKIRCPPGQIGPAARHRRAIAPPAVP